MMDAPTLPSTMTAWTQSRYGGPEVVAQSEAPVPSPGVGEVLLAVRATALNSADVKIMRGIPLIARLSFGLSRPKTAVRGLDVAGTVVAVGTGTDFAVGDEVVGELPAGGGLAPFVVAPASRLVRIPEGLEPETAATLPIAAGTAWQALDRGSVADGDRVLVVGASGGVGTFAVQLAALRGAEVHALCGARSRALVEGLGAVRTFDYRETDASALPAASYDVVIDIAGRAPLRVLRGLVRAGGRVVLASGEGGRFGGPVGRIIGASFLSIGSTRPLLPLAAVAKSDVLAELLALAADGRIAPAIEHTWPLAEAGAALAHVDSGRTLGKVVVTTD
jgi:NADPH:quinone reductase-like Zn-dependent oxidoreductase